MKRETGENPVRSRRCMEEAKSKMPLFYICFADENGKVDFVKISKPEDLPCFRTK